MQSLYNLNASGFYFFAVVRIRFIAEIDDYLRRVRKNGFLYRPVFRQITKIRHTRTVQFFRKRRRESVTFRYLFFVNIPRFHAETVQGR